MSRVNKIGYDQWIEYLFNEFASCTDYFENFDIGFPDNWYSNPLMLVEHYTQFLENPVPIVDRFGKDLAGEVLWGLTSSGGDTCIEVYGKQIPVEIRDRAISAMGTAIHKLVPKHLTQGLWETWNTLDTAIFMYWDITDVLPPQGTDAGRALLQVCLNEMQSVLELDHPVAQLHALHGLSEFHISFPTQTEAVVDKWIEANPHVNPKLMGYARLARDGLVQ